MKKNERFLGSAHRSFCKLPANLISPSVCCENWQSNPQSCHGPRQKELHINILQRLDRKGRRKGRRDRPRCQESRHDPLAPGLGMVGSLRWLPIQQYEQNISWTLSVYVNNGEIRQKKEVHAIKAAALQSRFQNSVGGRRMNKVVAIVMGTLVAGSLSASADLIVGWDTWVDQGGDTYNASVPNGFTGVAVGTADTSAGNPGWANWGGASAHNSGASIDGTWGTLTDSPASTGTSQTEAVGLLNRTPSGEMTFTITNTSGSSWLLSGFHFDGVRVRTSTPDAWTLSILSGSAVTVGAVTFGTIITDTTSPFLDREDVDIDLTGLSDRTVDNGESVIFELAWTGGAGGTPAGGNNTMIDNVGVSASVVPEPSTLGLMAFVGGLLLMRRRRS